MFQVHDASLNGPHGQLAVRLYRPNQPTGRGLVWAHGGAFVIGSLDMPEADWVSRELASAGVFVVSVDYQLSPALWGLERPPQHVENPGLRYPVASEEVKFTFEWAHHNIANVKHWSLGGASAGANLAAGAALRLLHTDGNQPASLVLAYPTLHAVMPQEDADFRSTAEAHPEVAMFSDGQVIEMYENYLGENIARADIYAVPGLASPEQLRGLGPTFLLTSEIDTLRLSAEQFADQLRAAQVPTVVSMEPGAPHGHLSYPEEHTAQASMAKIVRWLTDEPIATGQGLGSEANRSDTPAS